MSAWIEQIVQRIGDAVAAHFALLQSRLRIHAALFIVAIALLQIAVIATLGALAALVLLLVPAIGTAFALLLVSGATLLVIAGGMFIAFRPQELDETEASASLSRERLAESFWPKQSPGDGESAAGSATGRDDARPSAPPAARALFAAISDPALTASAAFALVSILGVRRTIGLARGAAAAASAGTILIRAAKKHQVNGTPDRNDAVDGDSDGDRDRDGDEQPTHERMASRNGDR